MPAGAPTYRSRALYDASAEHRRVRLIANRLLAKRWESAEDLWKMQTDLLELQRDIQGKIAEEKRRGRKFNRDRLAELRDARWHSRHFGDALAWVLLGADRQFITSLSENTRVPISEDSHGALGMMVVAQHLASNGWGFPLLHDITDYLRIGDITFVRPGRTPGHVTTEIKTRLRGEGERQDDGTVVRDYEVKVHTMVGIDPATGDLDAERPGPPPAPTVQPTNRKQRQAVRMRDAVIKARAGNGLISDISTPVLNMLLEFDSTDRWATLRRLIREAHRTGEAAEVVDRAFTYVVLYKQGGVSADSVVNSKFVDTVKRPEFLGNKNPAESGIAFHFVPRAEDRPPLAVVPPYFLYPITRRAVFELLNAELVILVLVNDGMVCDALRERGFEVEARPWGTSGRNEIVIIDRFETAEGVPMRGEVHAMWHLVRDAILEFRSLDHILDTVEHMVEGMREHAVDGAPPTHP
jgi:hypothetical protein